MKTSLVPTARRFALIAAALTTVSCSSSIYDVRRANEHRSATGITEALGSYDPRTEDSGPLVSNVSRDSKGPAAYLLFVNLIRAPFIPLVGAMEIAGAAQGAYQ